VVAVSTGGRGRPGAVIGSTLFLVDMLAAVQFEFYPGSGAHHGRVVLDGVYVVRNAGFLLVRVAAVLCRWGSSAAQDGEPIISPSRLCSSRLTRFSRSLRQKGANTRILRCQNPTAREAPPAMKELGLQRLDPVFVNTWL
jgi:hypothetical protein